MATDIADLPLESPVAAKTKVAASTRSRPAPSVRTRGIVVPVLKKMCWIALGVAAFMTLLFLLDIFVGFPFAGASPTLDVFGILGGAVIGYLAWDTTREIR
ncbi:MAG TPA: hypothetical protein PLN21_01545 [Gemmatales bacterium]|nr:hypothetical protein [Gemmatales bacterium]